MQRQLQYILFPEFNKYFDEYFGDFPTTSLKGNIPIEVIGGKTCYRIRAIVAGADPDKLQIHVEGKNVTISGEAKDTKPLEEDEYVITNNIKQGSFSQKITLPESINSDEVSADLNDGILELKLPKADPSSGKTIKINRLKDDKK